MSLEGSCTCSWATKLGFLIKRSQTSNSSVCDLGALEVRAKLGLELYHPWPWFSKAQIWLMETWPQKKIQTTHNLLIFGRFPPPSYFFKPQTFNAMLAWELFPVANNTLHCCSAFNPKISKCFAGINELSLITPLWSRYYYSSPRDGLSNFPEVVEQVSDRVRNSLPKSRASAASLPTTPFSQTKSLKSF